MRPEQAHKLVAQRRRGVVARHARVLEVLPDPPLRLRLRMGARSVTLRALAADYVLGQTVLVQVQEGRLLPVLGVYGVPVAPVIEPPDPPQPPQRRFAAVPVATGSYRNGAWTSTALRQGAQDEGGPWVGAAYYGRQFLALNADPATAAIAVTLRRAPGRTVLGSAAPTLWLLTEHEQPAGAPVLVEGSSVAGPALRAGQSATFGLPAQMVAALLGGAAGGVGIRVGGATPYIELEGRAQHPAGMLATVTFWRMTQ